MSLYVDPTLFATATQGAKADSAVQPTASATTSMNGVLKQASALTTTGAAAITDNSGGTASATIPVIGTIFNQANVANAIASLAMALNAQRAQQAELITNLKASGALHT